MRIDSYVRSMRLASSQAVASQTSFSSSSEGASSPALNKAVKANQARFDESSKGYVQAARMRDAVVSVDQGVTKARAQVAKLQSQTLTADQRAAASKEVQSALDRIDAGAKAQTMAANDKQLANKQFNAQRIATLSADTLGTQASEKYKSVDDLKKVDFSTASADDLNEIDKVLERAQQQAGAQVNVAQAQVGKQANAVEKNQATLDALGVAPNQKTEQVSNKVNDSIQAVRHAQALLQKIQTPPGGLFNIQA